MNQLTRLLKKHARFLIVLVVLLGVLIFANGQMSSLAKGLEATQTSAKSLLSRNYRALFADARKYNGEPATVEGRKLQDKARSTAAVSEGRNEKMSFVTSPEFTTASLPASANTGEYQQLYRSRHLEVQQELGFKRYFVPDVRENGAFGYNEPSNASAIDQKLVTDFLRKLDIVRTVAYSVERTGVQRLLKLQFVNVSQELIARKVPAQPLGTEPPFMTGEGLEFDVQGTEQSIYNLLLDLQRPEKGDQRNRYLSIESFTLEKPDLLQPKDALLTARIRVVAWVVNEQSTWPEEKADTGSMPQSSGPRTFNR